MPSFEITAPDGKRYAIDAPEGATAEQALEHFKANWQPEKQMSDESPLIQAARGFSQKGKEAAVGLAELTGLVPESVSQNVRAEREWVKQRPMAQAGSLAADIAMTAPAAMVNPAMAATIPGAAALAGTQAYLTTPGNVNERNLAGATGMAGGAVGAGLGKAVAKGVEYGANVADRLTAPFRQEGRNQIMARMLKGAVEMPDNMGGTANAEVIASRLANGGPLIKGSMPTAAEVGQSGGLSAIQRWAEQASPEPYAYRKAQNALAREKAVSEIAGNDVLMEQAKQARKSITSPLYDYATSQTIPIDKELIGLLKRPSVSQALSYAERISAEEGQPISQQMKDQILNGQSQGYISGQALDILKKGLDAMRSDPKNPLSTAEQNALKGTISKFESWREANIPEYAVAQAAYSEMSKPINRMLVGQELKNKLIPALAENTVLTRERANAFADAIRAGDITARKATGFKGATLEGSLGAENIATLEAIKQDLARKASAEELGRGVGSNTFQNFAMQDLAQAAGYPGALLARGVNKIPLVGELLTDIAEGGVKSKEALMRAELADILLDPKRTAELLRHPEAFKQAMDMSRLVKGSALTGGAIGKQFGE